MSRLVVIDWTPAPSPHAPSPHAPTPSPAPPTPPPSASAPLTADIGRHDLAIDVCGRRGSDLQLFRVVKRGRRCCRLREWRAFGGRCCSRRSRHDGYAETAEHIGQEGAAMHCIVAVAIHTVLPCYRPLGTPTSKAKKAASLQQKFLNHCSCQRPWHRSAADRKASHGWRSIVCGASIERPCYLSRRS